MRPTVRRTLCAMFVHLRRLAALLTVLAFLPLPSARAATPQLPDQIAAAWRTDPVYLDSGLRAAFPKTELDRIRAAAKTVKFPVYVALLPRTPDLKEQLHDFPTLLHARVGKPALYLVWTVSDEYWSGNSKLVRPAGLRGRDLIRVQSADEQYNDLVRDRPAPGIVRTIQLAATAYDGRALPQIPATDLEPPRVRNERKSVTDLEEQSAFTGMGIGGVLGFGLTLLLALRHRKRRTRAAKSGAGKPVGHRGNRTSRAEETIDQPVALSSVQQQADRWIGKAERALRSLESRREKSVEQLDRRDDALRRLDAARTLRKAGPDDLLATAGAFVLARQAQHAASGSDVKPPCFFDPTHPSGTHRAAWSDDTEVPACRNCAQLVERGRTPRGLRVPGRAGLLGIDRTDVPYWTIDPEDSPLVASGFGSLTDDLPEQVERAYGGVR